MKTELPILRFRELKPEALLNRDTHREAVIDAEVDAIIAAVRSRGDAALREYTRRFDGVDVEDFRVPPEELERAYDSLDASFQETLLQASANIERFHERQIRRDYVITDTPGVVM